MPILASLAKEFDSQPGKYTDVIDCIIGDLGDEIESALDYRDQKFFSESRTQDEIARAFHRAIKAVGRMGDW
jgi:hypothetical protein